MKVRTIILFSMLAVLLGVVVWEQIFIDNTISTMQTMSASLYEQLEEENLERSTALAQDMHNYWLRRQAVISLMVDYRDIEQIGRQSSYIIAHLNNQDFELARSECQQFDYIVGNFANMTHFDVHNIF
ncbi:MAG: DUF4363 family protein [Clostridia bacterium]|nr:DUF4363 family protein [Clostridia bacterium]